MERAISSRAPRGTAAHAFAVTLAFTYTCMCLITDGASEERGQGPALLGRAAPTSEHMAAVLAHVCDAVGSIDDLDLDPSLAARVQRSLAGPHVAPATEPVPAADDRVGYSA